MGFSRVSQGASSKGFKRAVFVGLKMGFNKVSQGASSTGLRRAL